MPSYQIHSFVHSQSPTDKALDSPLNSVLSSLASDDYQISEYPHTAAYKDKAPAPDLVLLNILTRESDHPDVYQDYQSLCLQLKKHKPTQKVPIVIRLGSNELEDIIHCFEMGASDVINVNTPIDELSKRLNVAIANYKNTLKLEDKAKKAKQTAFEAMEDSSKLGLIVEFLGKSAQCDDFEVLAAYSFEVFKQLNLHGSLIFLQKEDHHFFSDDGENKPIEQTLLLEYKHHVDSSDNTVGRFKTFGNRILVASDNASVLIRNAPNAASEAGRLRDLLGAFVNVIESRTIAINHHMSINRKLHLKKELFDTIQGAINELEALFRSNETETTEIMDTLLQDIQNGLITLALTDEQEQYFLTLLDNAMTRLTKQYTKNVIIDRTFDKVLKSTNNLGNAF